MAIGREDGIARNCDMDAPTVTLAGMKNATDTPAAQSCLAHSFSTSELKGSLIWLQALVDACSKRDGT